MLAAILYTKSRKDNVISGYKLSTLDLKYLVSLARHHGIPHVDAFLLQFPLANNYILINNGKYVLWTTREYHLSSHSLGEHCAANGLSPQCFLLLSDFTFSYLENVLLKELYVVEPTIAGWKPRKEE